MRTVLVTGVAGFCARHLVERLGSEPELKVVGAGRRPDAPRHLALDRYLSVDVTDGAAVRQAIAACRPDVVFHLAGARDVAEPEVYEVNLLGTVHLLEAVRREASGARVLLAGTAAEYGPVEARSQPVTEDHPCRPTSTYGVSKHAMTLAGLDYQRRYGLKVVIARPFNAIGPGAPASQLLGAMVARARAALAGGSDVVEVGSLDAQRDFVAVEDVVDAYVRMVDADGWGQVFNLCSGRAVAVREVVECLLAQAPRPLKLLTRSELMRPAEVSSIRGSYEKAARAFGFAPRRSLDDSLRAVWRDAIGPS